MTSRFHILHYAVVLSLLAIMSCTHATQPTTPSKPVVKPIITTDAIDSGFRRTPLVIRVRTTGEIPDHTIFIYFFGDSSTMRTRDSLASHAYSTGGKFIGKILLVDTMAVDTIASAHFIAVIQTKPLSISTGASDTGYTNVPVTLRAHTLGEFPEHATFLYLFGDGVSLRTRDSVVSHVYKFDGKFHGKLVILDTLNFDTLSVVPFIAVIKVKALITLNSLIGCHALHVVVKGAQIQVDRANLFQTRVDTLPISFDYTFSSIAWNSTSVSSADSSSSNTSEPPFSSYTSDGKTIQATVDTIGGIVLGYLNEYHYSQTDQSGSYWGESDQSGSFTLADLKLIEIDSSHILFGSDSSNSLKYSGKDYEVTFHEKGADITAFDANVSAYPVSIRLDFIRK